MKKIIFFTIVLFFFVSVKAQTNVIKANPLGRVFGIADVRYEIAFAEKRSSFTISGLLFKESGFQDAAIVSGYGLNVGYNFYFSPKKSAPRGFHAGLGNGVFFLTDDDTGLIPIYTLNATAGHQWILGKHFAVDIFAQYYYLATDKLAVDNSYIGVGLSLGYAW